MSDSARDLIRRGAEAAKDGNPEYARELFESSLRRLPSDRQRADAFYWLAKISQGEERRAQLEQVLQVEPTHFAARRDMAVLDGRLDPEKLRNPAALTHTASPAAAGLDQRRFVCPQCGGRMRHNARDHRLRCDYCGHAMHLAQALARGAAVFEEDFIQALATAKGHVRPEAVATIACDACGAHYLLTPSQLSFDCPHCGSTHVVEQQTEQLIPPAGVVPMSLNEAAAERAWRTWLEQHVPAVADRRPRLRPLYAPAWTFDASGEAIYRYARYDGEAWVDQRGSKLIVANDLLVPAVAPIEPVLARAIHAFDLSQMHTFRPEKLAGWPAETYSLPAAEAAMSARWRLIDQARLAAQRDMHGQTRDFQMHASDVLIGAYRLVLLPFWLTAYEVDGQRFTAAIDGSSGAVFADTPPPGIWRWLKRVFGAG